MTGCTKGWSRTSTPQPPRSGTRGRDIATERHQHTGTAGAGCRGRAMVGRPGLGRRAQVEPGSRGHGQGVTIEADPTPRRYGARPGTSAAAHPPAARCHGHSLRRPAPRRPQVSDPLGRLPRCATVVSAIREPTALEPSSARSKETTASAASSRISADHMTWSFALLRALILILVLRWRGHDTVVLTT